MSKFDSKTIAIYYKVSKKTITNFILTAMSVDSADNASARIRDCSEIDDEELKSSRASSDSSAGIKLETLPLGGIFPIPRVALVVWDGTIS